LEVNSERHATKFTLIYYNKKLFKYFEKTPSALFL
jgi:hypothetical protein